MPVESLQACKACIGSLMVASQEDLTAGADIPAKLKGLESRK